MTNEIPVNRELYYHSGKEKGSSAREDNPAVSEEIGKDAIKGHLIYVLDYSTYSIVTRAKTSGHKTASTKLDL
jgi:hypothetical protein